MADIKDYLENEEVTVMNKKVVKPGICRVCEQVCSSYFYYGAVCCDGCKQFFRRAVLRDKEPKCLNNSKCDLKKVKCRHCRYKKCLFVGMQQKFVKIKSTQKHVDFIEDLKQIERAYRKIWDSSDPLPEAYINRHSNLSELLQDKNNLLGHANQFINEVPFGWDKAHFIEELETNGLFSMHELNVQNVKDWFIMVELAKTFPFIKELSKNDQICQLKHIYLPARFVINSFYSYAINAKSITRKNGLEILAIMEAKQVRNDQRLLTLSIHCSCKLIDKMSEIGVNYEEFLLLLAILLSNFNADGLSKSGRQQLYNHCIRYSKALHNLCQFNLGFIGGSQKFASLISLLNEAISLKYKYLSMFAYMEVFYAKNVPNYAYPAIMHSKDAASSYT